MEIDLDKINQDHSIQCRAKMDNELVEKFSLAMIDAEEYLFPAIELYKEGDKYWIGDGWHRIAAAKMSGFQTIKANVSDGGRRDALRYALRANANDSLARTNEDKRRCVEICLKEFPKLSSRGIAQMCGVSDHLVAEIRGPMQLNRVGPSPEEGKTVITSDGRVRPTTEEAKKKREEIDKLFKEDPDMPARQAAAIAGVTHKVAIAIKKKQNSTEPPKTSDQNTNSKLPPLPITLGEAFVDDIIRMIKRIPVNDPKFNEVLDRIVNFVEQYKKEGVK